MRSGTVLVTGASRGIGRAIVEALVESGRGVAFTYRRDEAEAEAVVTATGGRAHAFRSDLSEPQAADLLVEEVEATVGPISGLVNNAGVRADGLVAMTSSSDWSAVLDTNLGIAFRCCRAVLPGMAHRRDGAIVNMTSLSAFHGVAGQGAYAASKAGLVGLTRSLAREMGRRSIRVNAVAPGYVATEMTADVPDKEVRNLRAGECLPGGVDVGCVADTVCFLLSPKARSITGQCWIVDAGVSA